MRNVYSILILGLCVLFTGCFEEDEIGPVIGSANHYTGPEITSSPAVEGAVFAPEDDNDTYEEFTWKRAEYGVQVPVNYTVEVGDTESFEKSVALESTSLDSVMVTVKKFNDAVLALGYPGYEEATVFVRVKASVKGEKVTLDSMITYSAPVSRTVTPYRLSECGNFCTVGIIGSATPGGWSIDTDMRLANPDDKYTWTKTLYLNTGEVKFRAMDDWATNWGAADFPSGTGVNNGPNIPIATAGYYKVDFNDLSGEYTFTLLSPTEHATIGILGDATAGGWSADTDLTKDAGNPHLWTATITLTEGKVKFRANDDWGVNWGGASFASGYGVQGGSDIPVKAGTYSIWFNDVTGEYAFMNTSNASPYPTIGLLGDATPGGWGEDTDLIQDPSNPYRWSAIITVTDGEAKFRANDAWDVNWGGSGFPDGTGTQGGSNIPAGAGKYVVSFHSGTGEYRFLK